MQEIQRRKQTWAGKHWTKSKILYIIEGEKENEGYVVFKCRTLSLLLKTVFFPLCTPTHWQPLTRLINFFWEIKDDVTVYLYLGSFYRYLFQQNMHFYFFHKWRVRRIGKKEHLKQLFKNFNWKRPKKILGSFCFFWFIAVFPGNWLFCWWHYWVRGGSDSWAFQSKRLKLDFFKG